MPTPNQGETERHFIARCVIDDEARRDFPDADQRLAFCYSQYKNKDENYLDTKTFKLSKKFGDAWKNANEKQRLITERRNTKRFTAFYNKQYNLAIKNKLELNDIRYSDLFKYNDLRKLYDEMYLDTGLHFAKWYARTFDLYIAKGVNPKQYLNQWQLAIIAYAQKNTAMNITGVANTGRKTAIKIIQRLFRDPNFVTLGASAKARLLRKQLKGYSKYQALRVVRTETTRAANFGIQQSATSVFAGRDLIKRWSTSLDGRERDWHGRANNQERPKNDPFVVGGEYLMRPGEGSARNVINCRCSAVYLPVKDAQTINQLEGMNFGLAGSTVLDGVSVANVMRDINNAVGSTLVSGVADTLKELRKQLTKTFDDMGYSTTKVALPRSLSLNTLNDVTKKITSLIDKYKYRNNGPMQLLFKSTKTAYGYVQRAGLKNTKINLGDKLSRYNSHRRGYRLDSRGFDRREFSNLDEKNLLYGTAVHEMAHVLSSSRIVRFVGTDQNALNFWKEIGVLNREYYQALRGYKLAGNAKGYNKIYLGNYSRTNIDEFFAEAWTEYHLSSTPSKYANMVGELVNKYYAK